MTEAEASEARTDALVHLIHVIGQSLTAERDLRVALVQPYERGQELARIGVERERDTVAAAYQAWASIE